MRKPTFIGNGPRPPYQYARMMAEQFQVYESGHDEEDDVKAMVAYAGLKETVRNFIAEYPECRVRGPQPPKENE